MPNAKNPATECLLCPFELVAWISQVAEEIGIMFLDTAEQMRETQPGEADFFASLQEKLETDAAVFETLRLMTIRRVEQRLRDGMRRSKTI